MARRPRLVAGNWKMNGSLAANRELLVALRAQLAGSGGGRGLGESVTVAVCAPYPYLQQVSELLAGSSVFWGAQDVSTHDAGAFTGEVSGPMLREFGCRYAIVGHSERRTLHGESDALVVEKFRAAQRAGLVPVFCFGETLAERDAGRTEAVVARQLDAVLDTAGVAALGQAVLAYEPVWAIGTGKTATPAQAQAVHAFVRARIAVRDAQQAARVTVVYGGSVKGSNAKELFEQPDIDGGLIGGASLVAGDFAAICAAAV